MDIGFGRFSGDGLEEEGEEEGEEEEEEEEEEDEVTKVLSGREKMEGEGFAELSTRFWITVHASQPHGIGLGEEGVCVQQTEEGKSGPRRMRGVALDG